MQIFDDVREATFKPARKKMTADYEVIRLAVCKIKHCQSKQGIGCGVLVGLEDSKLSKYIIITSSQVIQEDNFSDGVYEVNFSKATKEKTFDLKNITKLVRHVASGLVVIFIDSSYSGLVHNCGKTCSILSKSPLTIADYDQRQQLFCYVGNQCYIVESHGESEEYVLKAGSDKSDTTAKSTDAPDEIPNGTVVLQGADKNVKAVGILNVVDDKRMVISPIWLKSSIAGILGKRKDEAKNGATMTDREEQPSLQSAIGKKSEKPQNNSCQSSSNSKEQPNPSEVGLSHSSGHKPRETTHKMSHSLDHTGSPDCLSVPPCPRSKSLETSDNKNTPNQQRPSAQQHGLSTVEQAPSSSEALNRRNHEQPNGASHTEHQSTIPATDGETLNPVNSEMPADGTTVAGISSSSSTQEPPVVTTTTTAAAAAVATTTGEPQNSTNSGTSFVDGSPHGNQASTVSSVTARAPAVEPQNSSSNESSVDGVTAAVNASLSSNQESSAAGSASADGESQNPTNNESPVDGAAAADYTSPSNQEQPAVTNVSVTELRGNKSLQDKLRFGLDHRSNPLVKHWEHLAEKLDVPYKICLKCKLNSGHSCTMMLLEVLAAEKKLKTVNDLISRLKEIQRIDLATDEDLRKHAEEQFSDFFTSLGNSELITKIADKLDQKSRVNKYWRDLGSKYLSSERLQEIEYGPFNPTQLVMEHLYSTKPDLTIGTFYDVVEKKLNQRIVLEKLKPILEEVGRDELMEKVVKLDSEAMRSICVRLNTKNRALNNWKNLANAFGIPRDIYQSLDEAKPMSPTESLFEWIFVHKGDLTVGQLCNALGKIERNDLAGLLSNHFLQNKTGQM